VIRVNLTNHRTQLPDLELLLAEIASLGDAAAGETA
jgi:hypothetical protein